MMRENKRCGAGFRTLHYLRLLRPFRGAPNFGEEVHISIKEIGISKSLITIESHTKFVLQLFDWGKNKENEIRFVHLIRELGGDYP